jgi:hypothetical protein
MSDANGHTDPAVAEAQRQATEVSRAELRPSPWPWVLCLLGVDYFSTLAYQPGLTFEAAGLLGPLATVVVVLVTLAGVLPIYLYVTRHSPHGEGSIALLEHVLHGWVGKTAVLVLLGFAATDFVMLKTISLADAAAHLNHNAYLSRQHHLKHLADEARSLGRDYLGDRVAEYFNEQLVVTILLGVVGFGFWFLLRRGFNRKAVGLAVPLVVLYLLLNAVVIGAGLVYLAAEPERLSAWWDQVGRGDWHIPGAGWRGAGWGLALVVAVLSLPQLSLGLSGFEMSMIVMPQVRGRPGESPAHPRGRIRNTRKLLFTAVLIMSVYLLGAVLVTTLLVPPWQFGPGGLASDRALAYLAAGGEVSPGPGPETLAPLFGPAFGAVYDLCTIFLLCLAGTSIMTALGVLLPRFLLRFGMELRWARRWGVLFLCFAGINLVVTVWFRASVQAQRGAYATGVLALILCACVVTYVDRRNARRRRRPGRGLAAYYGVVLVVFALTLAAVVFQYPSGLLISACFIGTILASSVVSRALRTDELRTIGMEFADEHSRFLWCSLQLADFPVLVPHRPGRHQREQKEATIRRDHQLAAEAEIVFLEVEVDDPSNFYQKLLIAVFQEGQNFVIKVTRCASVAHAVAAVALEMSRYSKPPGLHFGWSELDLLAASWSYLAFGEGNVPWKVRELIREAEPNPQRQPRVIIG